MINTNNYLINVLSFIENVKNFLTSLTLIDVVFFFSVIALMILIVILLYFIKSNEDYIEEDSETNLNNELNYIKPVKTVDETLYYNSVNDNAKLNSSNDENKYDDEEGELLDLASITKALENKEVENIDLTSFEEEQERDAIISYDELLQRSKPSVINYKKESMMDDLSVKEVDLDNFSIIQNNDSSFEKASIRYDEEESFLEALKTLQKQLS